MICRAAPPTSALAWVRAVQPRPPSAGPVLGRAWDQTGGMWGYTHGLILSDEPHVELADGEGRRGSKGRAGRALETPSPILLWFYC